MNKAQVVDEAFNELSFYVEGAIFELDAFQVVEVGLLEFRIVHFSVSTN